MATHRAQLYHYAGGKCCFCGKDVTETERRYGTIKRQFEFNHINPSRKHPAYENLIERKLSTEQLDEIDKCVLLCRNCHGLLHAQCISAQGTERLRVGHLRRQQTWRGCGLADFADNRFVIFCDQQDDLELFTLRYERCAPRLLTRRDFDRTFLTDILPKIRTLGELSLRDTQRTLLLLVTPLDSEHFQIQMDVRCPLIQLELHNDRGKPHVWVRNGKMLTSDGETAQRGVVTLNMLPYSEWCRPCV